ncbi:MAG: DUF1175 family protein [Luteitalea sp.]|nr:DUF1175 family protein [Luteitalea sp.]
MTLQSLPEKATLRADHAVTLAIGALLLPCLLGGCGRGSQPRDDATKEAGQQATSERPADVGSSRGDRPRMAPDAADREAFRAWFVLLADAQFYRTTSDVTDCAALVRHAAREALRPHTPDWLRRMHLPVTRVYPEVAHRPAAREGMLPIFRVAHGADVRYVEFADARTIVRDNADRVGRNPAALRPGDLLAFHQPQQDEPYHLMVFVGRSVFEAEGDDWIVYHTGPLTVEADESSSVPVASRTAPDPPIEHGAGEVRKVRLDDLTRHPAPRWRPVAVNPRFLGVYRLQLP